MIDSLLIANRGEIACRIIHTARRMGIRTVAVYSDADAGALHVSMADEAIRIGPAPATDSYLDIDRVVGAAASIGADAVHPGYGFLAENETFAETLGRHGIIFVGPPASAIRAMGSKSAALTLMAKSGVPVLPGYRGTDQSDDALRAAAQSCGYPLIVKPVAGGGGKGMRIVLDENGLAQALHAARREAIAAFGNGDLLLEGYLESARHVEVQVFADTRGNAIHLFERDCSIQRRHQKIIEEAPAPGLGDDLRARIGEVAVHAARSIGYVGAGTVEFLFDTRAASDPDFDRDPFYFMEMNTRLQVEHPVTEMILGVDLVEWQIRVAAGQALPKAFSELRPSGHAIEARIYAEDPTRSFLPATGRLRYLRAPADHSGIRIDSGVRQGDEISVYYDPMIAKLVAHGASRTEAVRRLRRALESYEILGVTTNVELLRRIVTLDAYASADLDTTFIDRFEDTLLKAQPDTTDDDAAVAAALHATLSGQPQADPDHKSDGSPWRRLRGFRVNAESMEFLTLRLGEKEYQFSITGNADGFLVSRDGSSRWVRATREDDEMLQVEFDGQRRRIPAVCAGRDIHLLFDGRALVFSRTDPDARHTASHAGEGHLTAPMPGKIIAVLVESGAEVKRGQALVIMEAMKMEHTITAPFDGRVETVQFAVGELVLEGAELIHLTTAS